MFFNLGVIGWLLGQGLVIRAIMIQPATSLLNMLLCMLFVLHFGLGLRGVAPATVTAEITTASGWRFSKHIGQADDGCDFDFLEAAFGRAAAEPEIY